MDEAQRATSTDETEASGHETPHPCEAEVRVCEKLSTQTVSVGIDGSRTAAPKSVHRPAGGVDVGTGPKHPNLGRVRHNFAHYMISKGLRSTAQRRLILDTLSECDEHPTIDDLLIKVRAIDSRVGHTTVYRMLRAMVEGGIARELRFGDGRIRYEVVDDETHHDHLICRECGLIIEFLEPLIEALQERIALRHEFVVTRHKHELYGTCGDQQACAERRKRMRGPEG